MGTVLHLRTIRLQTGVSNNLNGKVKVERQLVGLPWAADCCPWEVTNRVTIQEP
jgi:hypothetical protein